MFRLESKVRGYHVYQAIWTKPCIGDELVCQREAGNSHELQAVATKKHINSIFNCCWPCSTRNFNLLKFYLALSDDS